MQKPIVIILVLFMAFQVKAQEPDILQSEVINALLSEESNPSRIIQMVDSLHKIDKAGYDAYLWAAEASYNLGKFYLQQHYLEQAHHLYPNDTRALPALYASYLNLGNYPQALRLNKMLLGQQEMAKYYAKRPVIHLMNTEYGYKHSSNDSFYNPLHYGQVGIGMRVKQFSWFHALSYLNQTSFLGTVNQYQYYSSVTIPLKRNWNISPACHVLYTDIANSLPVLDSSILQSTAFVFALTISKQFKNLKVELGVMQANLNQEDQFQIQPAITYYPFSNQRLFLQGTGTYFTENGTATGIAAIGVKPMQNLQLTASYLYAGVRNFAEQNGYFINNSFDETNNRYGLTVNYTLTPSLSLYGVFMVEDKEEYFSKINYNFTTGLLGIKKVF